VDFEKKKKDVEMIKREGRTERKMPEMIVPWNANGQGAWEDIGRSWNDIVCGRSQKEDVDFEKNKK
jgi:hypothetical protein